MERIRMLVVLAGVVAATAGAAGRAAADSLSIYDIQHPTGLSGNSDHNGDIVACSGGIVTRMFPGSLPRIAIQDPAFPDGWGGIEVKDWTGSLFAAVSVGDLVTLTNVLVEEYRGTTFLMWQSQNNPTVDVVSLGNPLPPPGLVTPGDIAAPVEAPPGEWYVADHAAERYEGMLLTVTGVTVTAMDLGKAGDNYNLHAPGGDCWASDYLNDDREGLYHPDVELGRYFVSITGILEQYDNPSKEFDYYQLLTTGSGDLVVPEPASLAILLLAAPAGVLRRRRRDLPLMRGGSPLGCRQGRTGTRKGDRR